MLKGLKTGFGALLHLQTRGYLYVWASFLAALVSLPIITAPAAWAGLNRLSYLAYRQPSVSIDDFWQGFRENIVRTLPIAFLNVVVVVLNLTNLFAYQYADGLAAAAIRFIWIAAIIVWFAIQLYVFPLLFAMETPSLRLAYRNAVIMALTNPFYTVGVWLAAGVILVISIVFPFAFVLITLGAWSALANYAVLERLRAAGYEKTNAKIDIVADNQFFGGFGSE